MVARKKKVKVSGPQMFAVTSSNLSMVGYDPSKTELHVEFHTGPRYVYSGVPIGTFGALLVCEGTGGSVGSLFHRTVKAPGYPYRTI